MIKIKNYFKLYELLEIEEPTGEEEFGFFALKNSVPFSALLGSEYTYESDYIDTLFETYIYPKYYDKIIMISRVTDKTSQEWIIDRDHIRASIYYWLMSTYENYTSLIGGLEANRANLLAKIKSSTVTKYRDTPQVPYSALESNDYNTNVTLSDVESDGGTIATRLAEVERTLKNYWEKWSSEFGRFVLYE